jgi:hypothetical protein
MYILYLRIIEDYHLKASQIYSLAGRKLACDYRLADIEQLISCIQNSGVPDTSSVCDSVLVFCVQVLAEKQEPVDVEPLVKLIVDTGNKVSYGSKLYILTEWSWKYLFSVTAPGKCLKLDCPHSRSGIVHGSK